MSLVFPTMGTENGKVTFTTAANYLSGSANAVALEASGFLDDLQDLKAIDFTQVGNLPSFNSIVWLGNSAGVLAAPLRPNMTIGNIQVLLDRLNQLVPPGAPTDVFTYADPGYSSQLQQPLVEKLLNDLVNGGYGIDTADEISLFNRARDREALTAASAVAEVTRQAAGTSFPMPQGSMYLALQRARQDEMSKNSSVNRDIALKRADLFVENRRRVIDQVLSSETLTQALYNAVQNRLLVAAQTKVQLGISLFDAGIRLFNANIEGLKSQVEAQLEATRATVQIYASDVAAYAALVNAVTSGAQIDIENSRSIFRRDLAVYQAKVDVIKFQLQQLTTTVENRRQINEFSTQFFGTGLGSALNGVNGLAVQSGTV